MNIEPLSLLRLCDTETTGFPPHAEMVEIGWTDLVLYPGGWQIEVDQRSAFVDPGFPIPTKATEVHGITDDMVFGAMKPDAARRLLERGATILAAHNVAFDRQFVRSALPWICTLECARKVWPDAPNHKNETLKKYLGIEVDGDAHRAGYDAAVSARIFLLLTKHLTIEQMIHISAPDSVPTTMPFGAHKGKRFLDIPDSYLRWIVDSKDMRKGMKIAAQNELNRRGAAAEASRPAKPASKSSAWDRGF